MTRGLSRTFTLSASSDKAMIQANPANSFVMQLIAAPLTAIANHYASCLSANAKAMQFVMDELKLTAEQALKEQIGFADRSLGTLIPVKTVKSGKSIRDSLTTLGVYKANGRETLRGRVTVPIRNAQGTIIGIRGHKLDKHAQGPAVTEVGETGDGRRVAGDGRREMENESEACLVSDHTKANAATIAELQAQNQNLTTQDQNLTTQDQNLAAQDQNLTTQDQNLAAQDQNLTTQDQSLTTQNSTLTTQDSQLITQDSSLIFHCDDRHYRIRGLEKNSSTTTLKVNLMVSRDSLVHLDSLDLVKARSRAAFVKAVLRRPASGVVSPGVEDVWLRQHLLARRSAAGRERSFGGSRLRRITTALAAEIRTVSEASPGVVTAGLRFRRLAPGEEPWREGGTTRLRSSQPSAVEHQAEPQAIYFQPLGDGDPTQASTSKRPSRSPSP